MVSGGHLRIENMKDTGDDSLCNVRRLRAENEKLRSNLSGLISDILQRDGKTVFNMSANDRLAELHSNEKKLKQIKETFKFLFE